MSHRHSPRISHSNIFIVHLGTSRAEHSQTNVRKVNNYFYTSYYMFAVPLFLSHTFMVATNVSLKLLCGRTECDVTILHQKIQKQNICANERAVSPKEQIKFIHF